MTLWVVACGVSEDYARAWEENHKAKFLPGYTDYRGEENGTEDGYVVMSYSLPPGLAPPAALGEIEAQMAKAFPCYKVVERSQWFLSMRCPGGLPRDVGMQDEEYQFLVRAERRRVYIFALDRATPGFGGREYLERFR